MFQLHTNSRCNSIATDRPGFVVEVSSKVEFEMCIFIGPTSNDTLALSSNLRLCFALRQTGNKLAALPGLWPHER